MSTRSGDVATEAQGSLIERARKVLEADERVIGCWLEGSFARGTADAWSDVDLHVAVANDRAESFVAERITLVELIGHVLAHGEAALPSGAQLVFATLSGPVRLDLYIERESRLGEALRFEEPRVLFDRGGVRSALKIMQDYEPLARARLEELMRLFFFGAMWPSRLAGRREWGTLFANGLNIIYQFLVPAMLIQDSPEQFFRPHFHNERHLSTPRRKTVNGLVADVARAFARIDKDELELSRIVAVYERLLSAIWGEFRAACSMYGVEYPEATEQEMRDYHNRELRMFADD